MARCCRACSRSENFRPFSLYAVADVTQEVIADMILDTSGIQVSTKDGFPQYICPECLIALSLAYSFRKQCRRADAKFREEDCKLQLLRSEERQLYRRSKSRMRHENCTFEAVPTIPKEELDLSDYECDEYTSTPSTDDNQWVARITQPRGGQAMAHGVPHNADGEHCSDGVDNDNDPLDGDSNSMLQPMDDTSEMGECSGVERNDQDRASFSRSFNKQDSNSATILQNCNASSSSRGYDQPKTALGSLPRMQWTALALINRSRKGRLILEAYASTNILTRKDRIFITHLIIDEFVDEFGRLTREELELRAAELKSIFPTVEEHIWYKPPSYRDESGKRIKLGRIAKGSLYDRNNNYRCVTSVPAKVSKYDGIARRSAEESSLQLFAGAVTAEEVTSYQKTKNWFRQHQGEWDDILKQWKATSAVRLYEVSKLKGVTLQHLLDIYPVLRNNDGHQLVELDFTFKYPRKSNLLLTRFTEFRDRAKVVFRKDMPTLGKTLLTLLDEDLTEDTRDCITVMLMFFIWPCTCLRLANGKRWKPSAQESCESTILHLKSWDDYETESSRLTQLNHDRGLPDNPVIVVVGETIDDVDLFFVTYKDMVYETKSFRKALDIAFKIYKAYNISFPCEAADPWNFIAHMMYDFEPPEDDGNRARILTLAATLLRTPMSKQ